MKTSEKIKNELKKSFIYHTLLHFPFHRLERDASWEVIGRIEISSTQYGMQNFFIGKSFFAKKFLSQYIFHQRLKMLNTFHHDISF